MVLELRDPGLREGKPQVEQYRLDELAANGEAVLAGLGPLAAGLAGLAGQACRAVTLEAMEERVVVPGQKLLCGVVQPGLDTQAAGEVRLAQVTGEDGVRRARAERGHARPVVTRLGEVVVRRVGYRSGVRGAGSLFPGDAVLNCRRAGIPGVCSGWRRCCAGPGRMSRRASSCGPRPG
jgi:hypothetical protein